MQLKILFKVLSGILMLYGCGGSSGSTSDSTSSDKKVLISASYQVEALEAEGSKRIVVSLGEEPKSLYLLLSNYADTATTATITHTAKSQVAIDTLPHYRLNGKSSRWSEHFACSMPRCLINSKILPPKHLTSTPKVLHPPRYITAFTSPLIKADGLQHKPLKRVTKTMPIEGESREFYLDANATQTTTATVRRTVQNITTVFGSKHLTIWVSDDSFDSGRGCEKEKCVTQAMIDIAVETFVKEGNDNDIYDWVTNIYGEEWGAAAEEKYSNLIPDDDEITILLTDINHDGIPKKGEGRVMGFFWSKDNFTKESIAGSNEKIMFYIDAVMFANGEDTWDIYDFWPKESLRALAHEFQHMINFYQKRILLESNLEVWIQEMLSVTTEDLIANKMGCIGGRGIEPTDGSAGSSGNINGRYPLFNANNMLSLTTWNNQLENYAMVNAFGAYLIRNYGGVKLLHDIMHNSYTDEQSIVDAVHKSTEGSGKTFHTLLHEWGVAILLSDYDNLEDTPFYNTGDFTYSTYQGSTYKMGSINFFHYDPKPLLKTIGGTIESKGNYYYKVGENLTGDIQLNLQLNKETEVTLIAK